MEETSVCLELTHLSLNPLLVSDCSLVIANYNAQGQGPFEEIFALMFKEYESNTIRSVRLRTNRPIPHIDRALS